MSDAAETPEHVEPVADSSSAGNGKHRGPAAESEEAPSKAPGSGRHRRTGDES